MAALLVLLRVLHTNSDRRLALDMYAATTPLGEHVRIILIGPGLDAPLLSSFPSPSLYVGQGWCNACRAHTCADVNRTYADVNRTYAYVTPAHADVTRTYTDVTRTYADVIFTGTSMTHPTAIQGRRRPRSGCQYFFTWLDF